MDPERAFPGDKPNQPEENLIHMQDSTPHKGAYEELPTETGYCPVYSDASPPTCDQCTPEGTAGLYLP